jgi:Bardet-Biedl syndrome 9 protein
VDASVIVSKSAGKYRVQGTTFEGLRIIGEDLLNRLRKVFTPDKKKRKKRIQEEEEEEEEEDGNEVVISCPDAVPFNYVFGVIEEHLALRQQLLSYIKLMNKKALLLQAIERRLLVRVKETHVSTLSNMDVFFELVLKEQQENVLRTAYNFDRWTNIALKLENAISVMLLIAQLKLKLTPSESQFCNSLFCSPLSFVHPIALSMDYIYSPDIPVSQSTIVGGWEETVENSLLRAMKNLMSRSGPGSESGYEGNLSNLLEFPKDASRIKKTIQVFFLIINYYYYYYYFIFLCIKGIF